MTKIENWKLNFLKHNQGTLRKFNNISKIKFKTKSPLRLHFPLCKVPEEESVSFTSMHFMV